MRHDSITRPRRKQRHAFTLIEVAMAQVIVGVAIAAMCELFAGGTRANIAGTELTTAVNLAGTIHEIALAPAADKARRTVDRRRSLWDLNGREFSPAIDANRAPIAEFEGWSQRIKVQAVDAKDLATDAPDDPMARTVRLSVSVYHNGRYIYGASWILATDPP